MVGMEAKIKFKSEEIKKRVKQASFESLTHASAAIRLTAKRSIRKRAGADASEPGQPPFTHPGRGRSKPYLMPRSVVYHVEKRLGEAVVGPEKPVIGMIGHLHEFGGVVPPQRRGRKTRRGGGQEKVETMPARHYPARPFMGPALEKLRPRLTKFWENSVH